MLHFPNITLRQLIQYGCLHLPENAEFTPLPLMSETTPRGTNSKRVVLCPFVQGTWLEEIPVSLFESLTDKLKSQGFSVYTNLAASDKSNAVIQGTQPLKLTLEELEDWLSPEDCVIGLRSGIMDFVAYLGCRMICLYPHKTRHKRFYSLSMLLKTRSHYIEYEMANDLCEDLSKILEIFGLFNNKECNTRRK